MEHMRATLDTRFPPPALPHLPLFPSTSNRATLHLGAQAGHLGHSQPIHHPHPPLPTSHQDQSEYFPNSSTGNRCHPNGSPSILLQHCNAHLCSGPHNPFPTGSRRELLQTHTQLNQSSRTAPAPQGPPLAPEIHFLPKSHWRIL